MAQVGSINFRLTAQRRRVADGLAVEIANAVGRPTKRSDVINFILDKYLSPSIIKEYAQADQDKKGAE